jgi:hypothetical protein
MTLVLHPSEEAIKSKVGVTDEILVIDHPEIVKLLIRLLAAEAANLEQLFLPIPYIQFVNVWKQAAALLQLEPAIGIPHVYALRHSGASADALHRRRSDESIKNRGRWSSSKSMLRYKQGGRSQEQLQRCSTRIQKLAERCERSIWEILAGRVPPLQL